VGILTTKHELYTTYSRHRLVIKTARYSPGAQLKCRQAGEEAASPNIGDSTNKLTYDSERLHR